MTTGQTIDYEALAQEAMRGLVRSVISGVAKSGLPGDHHFYISFDTGAPGVSLSKRLKEKYPNEMTIVLQHRFWDLAVAEDRFEVKLTFDGIPERLVVPFAAIKVFFDPSVRYGLQFDDAAGMGPDGRSATTGDMDTDDLRSASGRAPQPKKPRAPRKPRADRDVANAAPEIIPASRSGNDPLKPVALNAPRAAGPATPPETAEPTTEAEGAGKPTAVPGAQIVRLDQFRKK